MLLDYPATASRIILLFPISCPRPTLLRSNPRCPVMAGQPLLSVDPPKRYEQRKRPRRYLVTMDTLGQGRPVPPSVHFPPSSSPTRNAILATYPILESLRKFRITPVALLSSNIFLPDGALRCFHPQASPASFAQALHPAIKWWHGSRVAQLHRLHSFDSALPTLSWK